MTENYKIHLFDDSKVSDEVKRLVDCFNIVAANPGYDHIPEKDFLQKSVALYKTITAESVPVIHGNSEKAFLQMEFLKVSAKLLAGKNIGWQSMTQQSLDKTARLMDAALTLKLIR
jgi:hypothetical protein